MVKISDIEIKDDITVTQPVDLDQMESDVSDLLILTGSGGATIVEIDDTDSPYETSKNKELYINTITDIVTVLLPATVAVGDKIKLIDAGGAMFTNNLTIDSNGKKIRGTIQDITVDVNWSIIEMFYTGLTNGWNFKIYT